MDNYADIINFDWESAAIGVCQEAYGYIKTKIDDGSDSFEISSNEAGCSCRFLLSNLKADCVYKVKITCQSFEKILTFKTLPSPKGKLLCSYAAIADPHVSERKENRKGRLFIESGQIFRGVIEECTKLQIDFALIAGDLTNDSQETEYQFLRDVLSKLDFPVICAPGDHDIIKDRSLWDKYIAEINTPSVNNGVFNIKAINTSNNFLNSEDAEAIKEMLKAKELPLILTHVHLLNNPNIKYSPKAGGIENSAKYHELFELLSKRQSLIYAGHQNIPSHVSNGKLCQINLPQPCQFPCSWYYVRVYQNGLFHKNMPIRSEILRNQSRIESQKAAVFFAEKQWSTNYRRGESPKASNFLLELNG